MKVLVADNNDILLENLTKVLQNALDDVANNKVVTIGLSGGSLVLAFTTIFNRLKFDWSKVKFFFCDERKVDFDHPDSTFGEYRKHFLAKTPNISEEHFTVIDHTLSVEKCAVDYENKLRNFGTESSSDGKFPIFDIVLLGLGPDGHTCSLFPNHALLEEKNLWVAPINDSPKPPPERVTITLPVLNNARNVIFVATGSSKSKVLHEILEANQAKPLPGGRVHPKSGKLFWLIDKAAASDLVNKF